MRTMLLLLMVCASLARADELLPDLAVPARDRERETVALDSQKKAAVTAAQAPYLTMLDAADQSAMTAGKVESVTGIAHERERVQKGGMFPSMPTDLPRNLEPARRTYLKAIEKVEADFTKRQLAVDANYLRTLASLQFKASSNPTLAAQIAAEKLKVASGVHGPITDAAVGLDKTRWKQVGGTAIWEFRDGKLNNTWRYETPDRDKVKIIWNPANIVVLGLGRDGKTMVEGGRVTWELMTPVEH